jgi:hypothetical protein
MRDDMKAIFHREVGILLGGMSWVIKASPEPQSFPRRVIEAAVVKGAATVVEPKRTYPPKTRQPG